MHVLFSTQQILNFRSCVEILLFYHNQFLYVRIAYHKTNLRKRHLGIIADQKVLQKWT